MSSHVAQQAHRNWLDDIRRGPRVQPDDPTVCHHRMPRNIRSASMWPVGVEAEAVRLEAIAAEKERQETHKTRTVAHSNDMHEH